MVNLDDRDPPQRVPTGRNMGTCPHDWQEKTSRHEAWRNPIQSCHTRANPCVCVIVYRVGAVLSVLCHFGSVYAHRAVRLS